MALNSKQQMKPYHKNPRRINKKQFEQLRENLLYLGDLSGIVHDLNSNEIVGGNQRSSVFDVNECDVEIVHQYDYPDEQGTIAHGFIIWKNKRYTYRQVRWTPKQCEQANITANRLGGEWDFDELANWDMSDLLTWGFEESDFPFDVAPAVEAGTDTEPQIDKAEELRQKWNVETGQMWQLGEHRIICGDCTDRAVVERVMGGEMADLCLTDPPYGIAITRNSKPVGVASDKSRIATNDSWDDNVPSGEAFDYMFEFSKNQIVFGANYFWEKFYSSQCYIVWDKRGDMPEVPFCDTEFAWTSFTEKMPKRYQVINHGFIKDDKSEIFHPTQKPLILFEKILVDFSLDRQTIYEPFSGSGTTIIACENLSRKCRAVEISPAYVAVAIQRWVDVTGKEPILLDA